MIVWATCPRCRGQNIPVVVEDRSDGLTPEPQMVARYGFDGRPDACQKCGHQVEGADVIAVTLEATQLGYAAQMDTDYLPDCA